MTKFFKLFINFLYFLFTLGLIASIAWGANAAVNIGGSNEDVPNLIKKESDSENTIYFSDVFGFFVLSVQNAHSSHEVFIGNKSTGEEKMWFIPMGWFNKGLTWGKNVVVATITPSYEIEQMQRYRSAHFIIKHSVRNGLEDQYALLEEYAPGKFRLMDPTYENQVIVDNFNIDSEIVTVVEDIPEEELIRDEVTGEIIENQPRTREVQVVVTTKYLTKKQVDGIYYGGDVTTFNGSELLTYSKVYENGYIKNILPQSGLNYDFEFNNEMLKYDKYRSTDYEKFDKFMNNKPVVKWAFAEVIIIVFLSFMVVYQNPIDFKQTNDGVTEMSKSFIPKFPKPRRRSKKIKRNKDKY